MIEERNSAKRQKIDTNNSYLNTQIMESTNSHDNSIAATLPEFLENPAKFRPAKEFLNLTLPDDETVLTHCIKNQLYEAVDALIAEGADPNLSSKKGVTPISAAAHKGNISIMQKLIIAGAAVNAINSSGSTALIQAAHFGHLNAVKLLLRHNAASDFANVKGTTALMRACQEGHVDITKCLVSSNVDVNRKNHEGMNALMLASQRGHAEIVLLLIRTGATMDEQTTQGSTALMLACKRGHDKCAEVLVCMGAEICMRDRRGRTAKDTATRRNHLGLVCWLDTQMQISRIQHSRQILRHQHLMVLRQAAQTNSLVLNEVDAAVATLCRAVKRADQQQTTSTSASKGDEADDSVLTQFLASSPLLPFSAKIPEETVALIRSVQNNAMRSVVSKVPSYRHSAKLAENFPGYTDWLWSPLLLKCMGMPSGVFEHIMEYMPLPRIWQWTLTKVKLRCKLSPLQAILDISTVMDEILCDANILVDRNQTQLLVKINKSPQIHSYLVESLGMGEELVDGLCVWADVQGLARRANEQQVAFKSALARQMLSVAIQLYRWYRGHQSTVKRLGLVLTGAGDSVMEIASGLDSQRLGSSRPDKLPEEEDGDLMEETDAGGEGSDNEEEDAAQAAADQDTGDDEAAAAVNGAEQDAEGDNDADMLLLDDSDEEDGLMVLGGM